MTNLAQNLLDTAAKEGPHPALRMDDAAAQLRRVPRRGPAGRPRACRRAACEPGDRVGMVLPNVLSFPVVFYGALLAGAAVVPMNPLLKAREVEYYLRDSGARLVVTGEQSAEPVAEAAGTVGIEAVTVGPAHARGAHGRRAARRARSTGPTTTPRSSSTPPGTTGQPKGAELTHASLTSNARTTAGDAAREHAGRRDHGLPAAVPRLRPDLRR